ncbi:MAG: hypothetical protein LUF30_10105, partial [Lachnospiraceae bacterium]|nr:hypothetical protein [Lachnospiraceae bacterium]
AYNRDDLRQLMSFLDMVSACEEFDGSWLETDHYERAIDTLQQIRVQQDALFTIDRAVRETIEAGFIGSGTAGKSAAKEESGVDYVLMKESVPEQNYREVNSSDRDWKDIAELRNAYNTQKERIVSLKQKWNDTCIEAACNGLRFETMTEVAAKKQELCEVIKGLEIVRNFVNSIDREIHIQHCSVSDGLTRIKMIVRILMIPYNYQLSWVTTGRFSSICTLVNEQEALAGQIKEQSAHLLENWEEEFLFFDCEAIYSRFKTDYTSFFKRIGNQYKEDKRILKTLWKTSSGKQDDDVCLSGMERLRSYQSMKKRFDDKSSELNVLLSGYYHGLDTNWSELRTLLGACTVINDYYEKYGFSPELRELLGRDYAVRRNTQLSGIWVETLDKGDKLNTYENYLYPFQDDEAGTLSGIKKQLSQIESMERTWADIEDMVYSVQPGKCMEPSVCENPAGIDQMEPAQSQMNASREYTDEGQCGADVNQGSTDEGQCSAGVNQSRIHRVGLNRDIKLSLINTIFTSITSVLDVLKQYEGVFFRAKSVFPIHYRGDKTDWNYVQECLYHAKELILYAGSHALTPAQTWYIGMKKTERDALVVSGMTLKDWMAADQRENLERVWAQTGCAPVFTVKADTGADIIAQMCSDSIPAIEAVDEIYAEVSSYFNPGGMILEGMAPAKNEDQVTILRNYLDVMDFLNSQHAQANRQFEHMGIRDVWSHPEELFALFDEYIEGFSEQVKEAASSFSGDRFSCENALRAAYQASNAELQEADALRRFASWFEKDILSDMSLMELSERIPLCGNFEELNSWQLYHSIRSDCEKKDLGEYLSYVESESVSGEQILPLYRKSFLTRCALAWRDSAELRR